MPLAPGDSADASDVWHRVLTADYWRKRDGRLHNSAFTGKALAPPKQPRGYTLEFSGRLLSLTQNVEQEARAFCNPARRYHGVIFQTVENLRSDGNGFHASTACRTDVIYTPNADIAHADIAFYGPTTENRYLIREWLQDFIQYAAPGNCGIIEVLRPPLVE
jgi:hypothetical protein